MGEVFIHADRIPLDQVDLSNLEDSGQLSFFGSGKLSFFGDECAGVCGV